MRWRLVKLLRGAQVCNGLSLPDGKARKLDGFGVKTAVVVSHQQGLMLGGALSPSIALTAISCPSNWEQATILMRDWTVAIQQGVDRGPRVVDADNPGQHTIYRSKLKSLNLRRRGWLRRRSAVEHTIGHLNADHGLDRC